MTSPASDPRQNGPSRQENGEQPGLPPAKPSPLAPIEATTAGEMDTQILASEAIRERATNLLMCEWLPAKIRPEGASLEQPVEVDGQRIIGAAASSILLANARFAHRYADGIEDHAFSLRSPFLASLLPADQAVYYAKLGLSGVRTAPDDELCPSQFSTPLHVVNAQFLVRLGAEWNVGEGARLIQPLKLHRGAAVFPIVGGIYAGNEHVPEEVLERLGIGMGGYPVRNEAGEIEARPLEYPLYALGGRSLLALCRMHIPVRKTPEGGVEVAYDLLTDPRGMERLQGDAEEASKMCWLSGVAVQWTGVGNRRYVYHGIRTEDAATAASRGEAVLKLTGADLPTNANVQLAQREAYAGEAGIFLDVKHQPHVGSPSGGLDTAAVSFERDRLLLRHGARMSSVTLAYSTLFTRDELDAALGRPSGMVSDKLQVSVKVIIDDTHRLDTVLSLVNEDKDDARGVFKQVLQRDFGSDGPEARDRYLTNLAANLGTNLRVLLKCGFALGREQRMIDNLSLNGGLLDTENLIERKNRYEVEPVFRRFVEALTRMAAAGGIGERELWRSPIGETFVQNLFSARATKVLMTELEEMVGRTSVPNARALWLTQAWVRRSLAEDRKHLDPVEVAKFIVNSELRITVDPVTRQTLREISGGRVQKLLVTEEVDGKERAREYTPQRFVDEFVLSRFLIATVETQARRELQNGDTRKLKLEGWERRDGPFGENYA